MSRRGARVTQGLIVVALTVTVWLAWLDYEGRRVDSTGIEIFRQENLYWNVSQLQFESVRFVDSIAAYAAKPDPEGRDRTQERFDVLWSRLDVFMTGEVGARLRQLDGWNLIDALRSLLEASDAKVAALGPASAQNAHDIAASFRALLPGLQAYASVVNDDEEKRIAAVQHAIVRGNRLGGLHALGALGVAVLLLIAAMLQVRADRRQVTLQQALTAEARAAADARGRFLTMMSHELRTPMNGVLGMLSVVDRTPLEPQQKQMIAIARRSAVEMLAMVEDILDLSDIHAGMKTPEVEDVSLGALANQLLIAVQARMADAPQRVSVRIDGDPDTAIRIERLGLIKAVRLIAGFVDTRLRLANQVITLAPGRGAVTVSLSAPDAAAAAWDFAELFAPLTTDDAAIRADAIGTTLARSLLQAMGGGGEMRRNAAGDLEIVITVPDLRVADTQSRRAAA